jgi:iron complex outermembrane receptor protein
MSNTILSKRNSGMRSSAAIAAALLSSVSFAGTAIAQTAPAAEPEAATAEAPAASGDIVVTARRKSENILKTPISIKALTSAELQAKGVQTIQDIAASTPGLNVQQAATQGGRADRSFSSIQLRGFVPSTSAAQTTSIFIDGAPVSVATGLQAITNPERIEVIKGPQSALFGRQTFAGAINVVTKAPADHLTGSVTLMGGTHANYGAQGDISAPIIDDVLSVRAGFNVFGKHGSYKNTLGDGATLGDQSTKSGTLAILFKPTSNLTFKAFGLLTKLKDGAPANGLISAYSTPAGQNLVIGQSNCNITASNGIAHPFFCGVAPGLSAVAPSANTATTAAISKFLANSANRVLSPDMGVKGYGLVNQYYHIHLNADWALGGGVTLSSLTAWNAEQKSELADLDNYYSSSVPSATNPEGFYNYPFLIEGKSRDFSQEFRGTFENGGPLHASAGGSYLVQRNQSSNGAEPSNVYTLSGAAQSRTYGLFGSVGYDFSSHFTLSGDARYQIDKLYAFAGATGYTDGATGAFTPYNGLIASKVYRTFLPRVIAQYNFSPLAMLYASYSKGVNPGAFNTTFSSSKEPQVRAEAARLGYKIAVDPEKITNYEVGTKGRIGNFMRYDAAAYLAIWTNQIQSQSSFVIENGSGPSVIGTQLQVVAAVNSGAVRVWGLEGNTSFDLAKGLELDLAGAYTKTYILSASNPTVSAFYNITNFRGKENPFVSKYSASASLAYTHPINPNADGFGRIDFEYKSGGWADIANVVRAPDLTQFNLRAGVRTKAVTIEGYVTNLFNNRAYYSVGSTAVLISGVNTGTAQYSGLIAALRDLRTMGVRGTFNF